MTNLSQYTDEQLIDLYKTGNLMVVDFLCAKYKHLVLKNAQSLFIEGGEMDDLIQEGMIGLFKAIGDYNPDEGVSFFRFANVCIRRQLINAIEAANRQKHKPLNSYESIYSSSEDQESEEIFATNDGDPVRILMDREDINDTIESVMALLSAKEKQVFELYIRGLDYKEIAETLGFPAKTVDNCLTRIKTKARGLTS